MPQQVRPRPYRDFLTPALHRRFTSASLLTIAVCYGVSLLQGTWDHWLWAWFPLGKAGIRTLLLFIVPLAIYILRVAQMHIGERTTQYPFETFFKYSLRRETIQTFIFHSVSAFWFCEVYMWSQGPKAKLGWTDHGKHYERIRLNERPIFLRAMFISLALLQSFTHLYLDYDRVAFPINKTTKDSKEQKKSAQAQLVDRLGQMLQKAFRTTSIVLIFGTFSYFAIFRQILWSFQFALVKNFSSIGKSAKPGGLKGLDLFGRFIAEGFCLVILWEFTNAAFDVYVAQEPLKKDKPITDDSKDPNGSLLIGLKSKKEIPKNVAFWELALIIDRFDVRRKAIFEEIERKPDSTLKQIVAVCIAEVNGIVARINAVQSPPPGVTDQPKQPLPLALVPRIAQPLREDNIAGPGIPPSTRLEKAEALAGDFAKTIGPRGSPVKKHADAAINAINTNVKTGVNTASGSLQSYLARIVRSPFGAPFRKTFGRTVNLVVNGTPYSRTSTIADAVNVLKGLVLRSLAEDTYGLLSKEAPEIIRSFATAIKYIDAFVSSYEVHWSDVDGPGQDVAGRKQAVPEVEAIREVLKNGLKGVMETYERHYEDLQLSRLEVQEAKVLAGYGDRAN